MDNRIDSNTIDANGMFRWKSIDRSHQGVMVSGGELTDIVDRLSGWEHGDGISSFEREAIQRNLKMLVGSTAQTTLLAPDALQAAASLGYAVLPQGETALKVNDVFNGIIARESDPRGARLTQEDVARIFEAAISTDGQGNAVIADEVKQTIVDDITNFVMAYKAAWGTGFSADAQAEADFNRLAGEYSLPRIYAADGSVLSRY